MNGKRSTRATKRRMRETCQHKRGIMVAVCTLSFSLLVVLAVVPCYHQANQKPNLIIRVTNYKEFKKLLRTKTNLLVIFTLSEKETSKTMKLFEDVAEEMKGKATMAFINCANEKKFCKKLKVSPTTFELKHYKDGEFNKDYDRKLVFKSMVNFLMDPKGDLPWEEDAAAQDVVHLDTEGSLNKLLRKEKRPLLVMFYAPWCGFCKRLKPEYSAAATELKSEAVLVGIDVDKPHHMNLRAEYNITGFPTLVYFEKGKMKMRYGGENDKAGIVSWMKNPQPPKQPEKESEWADEESDVAHLDDDSFSEFIKKESSVLVMFYAPWCGHCKKIKPEYTDAAKTMKEQNIPGILAAVDATKAKKMGEEYKIKGFPTVKYFKDGEFAFDVNERTKEKLVDFMKDPKEPPPPPPPEPKWEEQESDVVHLTEETFKTLLRKKKHALVMFYAPWCGHCKKAKPEFMAAASTFKEDSKVCFAALDCTSHTDVCTSNDVTGYPTFKYFNYGKNPQKYMGGREEPDFVNFMKDPLNPTPTPSPQVATPEDSWKDIAGHENIHHLSQANFDKVVGEKKSVLIMFYAPWCGHCKAMKPAYCEAATKLITEGIGGAIAAIDATVETALAAKYNVKGYPTLQYFKNGEFAFEYTKGRSVDDIVNFMIDPQAPPPPEPDWSDEKSDVLFPPGDEFETFIKKEKSVLVVFYAPWCGHCKEMKPAFTAAATRLKTEVPTAKMAAFNVVQYKDLAQRYDVKIIPKLTYFENGEEKMVYTGGRTEDELVAFMKNPQVPSTPPEPSATPPTPSTPPPPTPPPETDWADEKSDTNFLTSDNFEPFIKKEKSVLVMFYAPWCGHCKRMKPDFFSAATRLKKEEPSAKLAMVDSTKYKDISQKYDVKGFPTLIYFKDGEQQSNYKDGRKEDDLVAFMKRNSKPTEPVWSSIPSSVRHLTTDSFAESLRNQKAALIVYYTPGCDECSKLRDAYQDAAEELKKNKKRLLAAVDCSKQRELCDKEGVKTYPTIKLFVKGDFLVDYNGERTKDGFVTFLKNAPTHKDEL
ncbi:probable protein disulfide-isomerase A4 [Gigantopelta aegis]|uniref:probable protein disulfide-isomerase A4 n=1 Tax=Gigantopelta aegis TaxID=1735272 RepID=UPI001B88D126|nr:probable protein disulfide-isomerase A4 [Gigantopelta aegis]